MAARNPQLAHILLVEDDEALAAMVSAALQATGYTIWHVERAAEAEAAIDRMRPDLILLDLMLPDQNGLLVCSKLKARAGAPLIICSATKRKDDAALGLLLGADDFLHKPFTLDELHARVDLALRRRLPSAASGRPDGIRAVGALTIDGGRCQARLAGEVLQLTPTEYRLLDALASRPTEVFLHRELAERVWGCVDAGVFHSLEVHMRRLRGKLAAAGTSPRLVTRRGFGYQLVDETDARSPG